MTTQNTGRPRTSKTAPPVAGYRAPIYRVEPTPKPAGPLARTCHYALIVLGPVVLLSLLAAVVCYVRLLHGPVSLQVFKERIEQGISGELGGFKAGIDDAILTLGDDWSVEVRLTNLRVTEPDGDLVASAPLAAVDLDPGSLLWMHASPRRVFLIEPRLSLYYSEKSGLAMNFSQAEPAGGAAPPAARAGGTSTRPNTPLAPQTTAVAKTTDPNLPPSFHRIDLAQILTEVSSYARHGGLATSHLNEIGVRNATVVLSYDGKTSELSVAEGAVGLEGSSISGAASVNSSRGRWMVSFRTEEPEPDALKVTATVRDLIPSTLAQTSPQLSLLEMLDMPVAGDLTLELSSRGDFKDADLRIDAGPGRIVLPSLSSAPVSIDSANLHFGFDSAARRFTLASSTISWGKSTITFEGALTREAQNNGPETWHFGLAALDGVLAAEEFGVGGVKLESFTAAGRLMPDESSVALSRLSLNVGGAEITAKGEITSLGGTPSTRVEASMTPMPLATLKALWPRAAMPAARTWFGNHMTRGTVQSASLKLLSGKFLEREAGASAAVVGGERISLAAEIANVQMVPLPQGLPIEAPQALIRLENAALEVTVPEAFLIASPERQVPIKGGRFTVVSQEYTDPIGELAFRSQTSLAALSEVLNRSQLHLLGTEPLPFDGLDGKVDGQVKITMPLVEGGGDLAAKTEAKARITEIRGKPPGGRLELSGGSIDLDVSSTGVNASGDLIVNGVLAKIALQRIFDAPPNMQPPLRLTATLDNADRTQLKFDVNHLIQGEMPIEITVAPSPTGEQAVHARADLTNAELIFKELAWRKPAGRTASLEFDVASVTAENIVLKNFRVVGDNVAIEGSMTLDAVNDVQEFSFPNFSINVVSRLEVEGKRSSDKVWAVKVKGATFDAKDQLRSLLSLGRTADTDVKPLHPANGVDLTAEIGTVLGHSDVSLRGYKIRYSERQEQLVAFDAQGTLDGGQPLSIVLKKDKDGRRILAEAGDAGQALKFTGFYPNMQGGKARLEVDLEGRGAAEKSGVLWIDNFRVLGDPIVSEVYSSAEASGPAIGSPPQGQRRVQREAFNFERMKVPFSVGHGQFVLEDSYVRGQLLGASIRGKVDYTTQRINLGGTYVPLQGINSALCNIPLVGPIVSGLDCQGVFGITYAIQGPMQSPQVIVNPLSMLTPGILRGIMEMTNPNPEVLPRAEKPKAPVGQRVRASSSEVSGGSPQKGKASDVTVDGWSSQTAPAAEKTDPKAKDAKKKKPAAEAKPKQPAPPTAQ